MEAGKQSLRVVANRNSPGLVHFVRDNDYVFMEKRIRAKLSDFDVSLGRQLLAIDRLGIITQLTQLNAKVQPCFVIPPRSIQRVQVVDERLLAQTLGEFCLQLHRTLARAQRELQLQVQIPSDFQDFVAADTASDVICYKFELDHTIPTSELKDLFGQQPSPAKDAAVHEVFAREIARSPLPRYSMFRKLIAVINFWNG